MAPQKSRDYLRADSWAIPVYINGVPLPFVSGGSSEHPERFLSYFWHLYPADYCQQWLVENALRGYTHVLLSWPDSRDRAGTSIAQFVSTCIAIRAQGFYVRINLGSKNFDPRDQTLDQWKARLDPLLDALGSNVDEMTFMEYDSYNTTQDAVAIHQYFGQRAHAVGATFWCHFLSGHGFWGTGGYADWWTALAGFVDGLDLQTDPSWDIGDTQAHMVDHLNEPVGAPKLRSAEPGQPSLMFTRDHPNEDEANAFGYLAICTKAKKSMWGFGNGARMPDGSVL